MDSAAAERGQDGKWKVTQKAETVELGEANPAAMGTEASGTTPEPTGEQSQPKSSDAKTAFFAKGAGAGPFGLCGLATPISWFIFAVGMAVAVSIIIILSVVLTLPETVSCHASDEKYFVKLVGTPTLESVEPPMFCPHYSDKAITIHGKSFMKYNDFIPHLSYNSSELFNVEKLTNCSDFAVRGQTVALCRDFIVTIAQDTNHDEIGYPELVVSHHNPPLPHPTADTPKFDTTPCDHTTMTELVLIPPPVLAAVHPPAICSATTHTLTLTGKFLLEHERDGRVSKPHTTVDAVVIPPSAIDAVAWNITLSNCSDITVSSYDRVSHCNRQTLVVRADDHAAPNVANNISLSNPPPADCHSTNSVSFLVINHPNLVSAVPSLVCTDRKPQNVTLHGSGFVRVDGHYPRVRIDTSNGTEIPLLVHGDANCTELFVEDHAVFECTTLFVTLPQLLTPVMHTPAISIAPMFLDDCEETWTGPLSIVSGPVIATMNPNVGCITTTGFNVTVTGSNFLKIDGQMPGLDFGGFGELPAFEANCTATARAGVETCDNVDIVVTVPAGNPPPTYNPLSDIVVHMFSPTNSAVEAFCPATTNVSLYLAGAPNLTAVIPPHYCVEDGDTLQITGSEFEPAFLTAWMINPLRGVRKDPTSVVCSDSTLCDVTWSADDPEQGFYDFWVANVEIEGCSDMIPHHVHVQPRMVVFFVDPPSVFNGVNLQVTIYLSGLQWQDWENKRGGTAAASITLVHNETGARIEYTSATFASPNVTDPSTGEWYIRHNRIFITIPENTPAGSYGVEAVSPIGCLGFTENLVTVIGTADLTITGLSPSHVERGVATGVSVTATAGDLVATPRLYLNPTGAGVLAQQLRGAILSVSTTTDEVSAIVPDTLTELGSYQLIVINPTGTVGVLDNALTVLPYAPIQITSMSPATCSTSGCADTKVTGSGFKAGGSYSLSLVDCFDNSLQTAYTTPISITITAVADTGLTFDIGTGVAFVFCQVQIVDNTDGATTRFTGLGFKNPNGKYDPILADFHADLQVPKRGLVALSGRINLASRFLYAIGGDTSNSATPATFAPVARVERSATTAAGQLKEWVYEEYDLPKALAFASGISIGRFLYLVGGYDNATSRASNSVYRAMVLSPLETSAVDLELDVFPDRTSNFTNALYYYSVSAHFPVTDANNPLGESLPGEPLAVIVPNFAGVFLLLSWQEIPGADGYYLYRSPYGGAGFNETELLVYRDCNVLGADECRRFGDDGSVGVGGQYPRPQGSLGQWKEVATLNTARYGHGVAVVPHPTNASTHILYVSHGLDDSDVEGTLLGDYEMAFIVEGQDPRQFGSPTQAVGAFETQTYPGSFNVVPRAFAPLTSICSPNLGGGNNWQTGNFSRCALLVGPGISAFPGTTNQQYVAFPVEGDGVATAGNEVSISTNGARSHGSCSYAGSNNLYIYGGSEATFGDTLDDHFFWGLARLDDAVYPDMGATFPAGLGGSTDPTCAGCDGEPIMYHSCVVENSLVYMVGGVIESLSATNSLSVSNKVKSSLP